MLTIQSYGMSPNLNGETVQEQIVGVIYEHLSGVAWEWYREQQELLKEEA